ncbi:MAG: histidine kinase [Prolixibacteraceae bacterium]
MKNHPQDLNNCNITVDPIRSHWKEIFIRFAGITMISLVPPWFELDYHFGSGNFFSAFIISFIRTALIWNGSMLIIQYSVNRFSMFKETLKLIVFQVFSLFFLVLVVEFGEFFLAQYFLKVNLTGTEKLGLIGVSLLITFMISSLYASTSFFIQWKENLLRAQALEKATLEAKYDTLRNQVNPHFLFNSLNTLIVLVNDNPVATRYVESMSEIMRYMLQSRDKEAVLLRDELNIAREYIFIQQNRFGEKLTVDFDVPEQFYHYAIPPLALQMLLENALKHNVCSAEHHLKVRIYISDNQHIVIENGIRPKIDKDPSTGVGLENIRNRYIHLTGKDISVIQKNGRFTVMLPLFEKSI